MRLLKYQNQKGQNTAEYAILIGLVIAAAVAMQTYLGRNFKGAVKFAVDKHQKQELDKDGKQISRLGTTKQYEPYYVQQDYDTTMAAYEESEEMKADGAVTRLSGKEKAMKETTRTGSQKILAPPSTEDDQAASATTYQ